MFKDDKNQNLVTQMILKELNIVKSWCHTLITWLPLNTCRGFLTNWCSVRVNRKTAYWTGVQKTVIDESRRTASDNKKLSGRKQLIGKVHQQKELLLPERIVKQNPRTVLLESLTHQSIVKFKKCNIFKDTFTFGEQNLVESAHNYET